MPELRLGWNKFGDAGAVNLASCIHNIKRLNIPRCNINEAGVEALAQSITRRDRKVKCCIISSCSITPQKLRNLDIICTLETSRCRSLNSVITGFLLLAQH